MPNPRLTIQKPMFKEPVGPLGEAPARLRETDSGIAKFNVGGNHAIESYLVCKQYSTNRNLFQKNPAQQCRATGLRKDIPNAKEGSRERPPYSLVSHARSFSDQGRANPRLICCIISDPYGFATKSISARLSVSVNDLVSANLYPLAEHRHDVENRPESSWSIV